MTPKSSPSSSTKKSAKKSAAKSAGRSAPGKKASKAPAASKSATARPVSKTALVALIKDLDWRAVGPALKENPELLDYRGPKGESLLHVCCGIDIEKRGLSAADSVKTAGLLLDASLDIDEAAFTEGDWKATPLWYAIGRGKNLELAKYLLKRGADPEHCLWAAAFNDSADTVRLLVGAGATVDARGEDTPLMFAVKWSHFAAANALLDAGADANVRDEAGKTALHYMLKKRSDAKYVQMLIEHGARLDARDPDGSTAAETLSRSRTPEYQRLARKYVE